MKSISYIILFLGSIVSAQNITGKIIDEKQIPIKNSTIEIENLTHQDTIIYADENGNFSFENKSKDNFTIYIKEYGFQDFEQSYNST